MIFNIKKKIAFLSIFALVTASCYGRQWKVRNDIRPLEPIDVLINTTNLAAPGRTQRKVLGTTDNPKHGEHHRQRNFNWGGLQKGSCIDINSIRLKRVPPGAKKGSGESFYPSNLNRVGRGRDIGINTCGNEKITIWGSYDKGFHWERD